MHPPGHVSLDLEHFGDVLAVVVNVAAKALIHFGVVSIELLAVVAEVLFVISAIDILIFLGEVYEKALAHTLSMVHLIKRVAHVFFDIFVQECKVSSVLIVKVVEP